MSITEAVITAVGQKLYTDALIDLPLDIIARLNEMRAAETSELARIQLDAILKNVSLAKEKNSVICQDTCISSYKVKIGTRAQIGGDIVKALKEGTALSTKNLPAIPHSVHPVSRKNTGDGTGPHVPIVHWDVIPGAEYVEITAQPAGGGGDLVCAQKMFSAYEPFSNVKKYIIDTVVEAGSRPCPPMIIGIGLGGMFEYVNQLA